MRSFRLAALALVAACLLPQSAAAQDRATLISQSRAATDEFDTQRAIRLARAALDPALGPLDSTWSVAVHVLTQTLVDDGQQQQAGLWARWALRQNPQMQIFTEGFLTSLPALFAQARTEVTPEAGDAFSQSRYTWPNATSTVTEARFQVAASGTPVTVLVTGVGLVGAAGRSLPPGSYDLEVSATGFLPLRIRREALPGVTTEFSFTLVSSASNVIADDVRDRLFRATVPLNVTRFGMPQACVAGVTADGGRLVITSYHAIRGADAVDADGAVRVAAWDATANLAVLMLPSARPDTLAGDAQMLLDGQALWGVQLANCSTPSAVQTSLASWEGRPQGALVLDTLPPLIIGSPFVDFQGRYAGTWSGGLRAAPATVIGPLLARARENIIAQNTRTPQEVATQENHRYGTVVVTVTGAQNASVRMTPLEAWQWEELAANGPAPFTFRAASGRYRMEVTAPGVPPRTQEITVVAGQTTRAAVPLVVAQAAAQPQRRGMPRWAWAAIIGGGAAAALALGGGGGGSGSSGGSITISVPVTP